MSHLETIPKPLRLRVHKCCSGFFCSYFSALSGSDVRLEILELLSSLIQKYLGQKPGRATSQYAFAEKRIWSTVIPPNQIATVAFTVPAPTSPVKKTIDGLSSQMYNLR